MTTPRDVGLSATRSGDRKLIGADFPERIWQKLDDLCHRGQSAAFEISCMNELTNTIDQPEGKHESTYALLMRSEERRRNLLELVIYPVLFIVAMMTIVQFALRAAELPSATTAVRITTTSGLHARAEDQHRGI